MSLSLLLDFIVTRFLNFILISRTLLSKYYALYSLYAFFNFYNKIKKTFYNRTIYVEEKNNVVYNEDYETIKRQTKVIELKLDTK